MMARRAASRLRHTGAAAAAEAAAEDAEGTDAEEGAGRSGRSSRGSRGSAPFHTEEGVAAGLKLLENENVKQVLTTSSKRYVAHSDVAHYITP